MAESRSVTLVLLAGLGMACGADLPSATPGVQQAQQPAIGSGADEADRSCQVVLRALSRAPGPGGFETECIEGRCWFVWRGRLGVNNDMITQGAVPGLLYHSVWDNAWWQAEVLPAGRIVGGYQEYSVRLAEHTVSPGMSLTSLMRTRFEVVPYIQFPDGSRHFDHNRQPDDFENYQLDYDTTWAVPEAPGICPDAPPAQAYLHFKSDWSTEVRGTLVPRGKLSIDYDLARLPQCFNDSYMGQPTWNTNVYGRFQPGGQAILQPLVDFSGTTWKPQRVTVDIPEDAQSVELWFGAAGRACGSHWDSSYGSNHRFDMQAPTEAQVGWAGDWGFDFTRACGQRQSPMPEPLVADSYVLQRACTLVYADVWATGLTDLEGADPRYLLAQVEFQRDDGPVQHAWLQWQGRVGNNFRYRWDAASADLIHPQWENITYRFRFSTDGLNWHSIGQNGSPRTIHHKLN